MNSNLEQDNDPAEHIAEAKLCASKSNSKKNINNALINSVLITSLFFTISCFAIPTQLSRFSIPEQSADEALTKLGEIAKTSIIFNYETIRKYRTNHIEGDYSIETALSKLLEGTPLTYEINNNYLIIIEKPAPSSIQNNLVLTTNQNDPAQITPDHIDEILVTGYLGSIKRSLIKKRLANSIIDGVSSEDLGKFPDQNVVESLQRITGVSIDRSGGEGQFITVRGFGPEFNNVLYNGRPLATENQGREFSFDVLAAEVISGADVHKTPTAKLETGGLGSTIDLAIAKPMELAGLHTVFRVERTYETLSKEFSPHYSGLISYSDETLGAMLSLNYQNRRYEVDSAVTEGWMLADLSYVANKSGPGNFTEARIPRNLDFRLDKGERTRAGGTFVFQWQPISELKLTLDALYSSFKINSNITSNANWTQDGTETFQSVHLNEHNTLTRYSYKSSIDMPADFAQTSQNRPTTTRELGINLDWNITPGTKIQFDLSNSSAKNANASNDYFVVAGIPNANPSYSLDPNQNYPTITYNRIGNISDLRSHVIFFEGSSVTDNINQAKLDITLQAYGSLLSSVDTGILYSQRTKSRLSFKSPNGFEFAGYKIDLPDYLFNAIDATHFLDGRVPATWYQFNPFLVTNYLWTTQNNEYNSNLKLGGSTPIAEPFNTWEITETPLEAYLQTNFDGSLGSFPWSANIGARYADTRIDAQGNQQKVIKIEASPSDPTALNLGLSDPEAIGVKHQYSNFLPSANIKLNITKEQIIELSASKTITRPTFNDLTPGLNNFVGRVGANQAWGGNPDLTPYESKNLDLAWSWYYGKTHFLGANLFYKSFDNFISQKTQREILIDSPEGNFLVTRPSNTISSSVHGLEIAFLHSFNNGFGVKANYTWVRNQKPYSPENQQNNFSLEGLSDSYNLIGFYEEGKVQAQISYNYRAEFLQAAVGEQSQPAMVEGYGQVDLSASYNFTPSISLFIEGINIAGEKRRSFSIYRERLLEYTNAGLRYSIGIRGTF